MTEVSVGALVDLPTDTGVKVECDGEAIAVFRRGDDVYALADRCSHAEASLSEGDLFDDEIECPMHGAAFDITSGKALTLPATTAVRTYPAEVRDGQVFVRSTHSEEADV